MYFSEVIIWNNLVEKYIFPAETAFLQLPWPGFEPGLLRPQRRVLTTIRSRLLGRHANLQIPIRLIMSLDNKVVRVQIISGRVKLKPSGLARILSWTSSCTCRPGPSGTGPSRARGTDRPIGTRATPLLSWLTSPLKTKSSKLSSKSWWGNSRNSQRTSLKLWTCYVKVQWRHCLKKSKVASLRSTDTSNCQE